MFDIVEGLLSTDEWTVELANWARCQYPWRTCILYSDRPIANTEDKRLGNFINRAAWFKYTNKLTVAKHLGAQFKYRNLLLTVANFHFNDVRILTHLLQHDKNCRN